jgi:hypothetical protein
MPDFQAIVDLILANPWYATILLGMGILALWLLRVFGSGLAQKSVGKMGEDAGSGLLKQIDINDTTRFYLEQASRAYSHLKFRGLPRKRKEGIKPPQLDQAYVSVQVIPESKREGLGEKKRAQESIVEIGGLQKQTQPVPLSEAAGDSKRLAIIGVAGSGKSTLLQWAGLAFARALLKKPLSGEQKDFVNALGGKPLVPFLIPCALIPPTARKTSEVVLENTTRIHGGLFFGSSCIPQSGC